MANAFRYPLKRAVNYLGSYRLRPPTKNSLPVLESMLFEASASSEVTGTVSATITPLAFSVTGLHGTTGTFSANLSPLVFSATGSQVHAGTFSGNLLPLAFTISGGTGATGEISAGLTPLSFSSTGEAFTPIEGTVSARLAPLVYTSSGERGTTGTVSITLAPLQASLLEDEAEDDLFMGTLNGKNHWYKTWRNSDGLMVALAVRPWRNPFKRLRLEDNELLYGSRDKVETTSLDVSTGPTLSSNGKLRLNFDPANTTLINSDGSISAVETFAEEEDVGLYTADKKLRVILDYTSDSEIDPFHRNGALRIANAGFPGIDYAYILEDGEEPYLSENGRLLYKEGT